MFSLTDTQTENSVTKAAEQSLLDEPGSYLSRQVRKTDRFLENFLIIDLLIPSHHRTVNLTVVHL